MEAVRQESEERRKANLCRRCLFQLFPNSKRATPKDHSDATWRPVPSKQPEKAELHMGPGTERLLVFRFRTKQLQASGLLFLSLLKAPFASGRCGPRRLCAVLGLQTLQG